MSQCAVRDHFNLLRQPLLGVRTAQVLLCGVTLRDRRRRQAIVEGGQTAEEHAQDRAVYGAFLAADTELTQEGIRGACVAF